VPKPSRPHGTLPAAFSATGQDVPPSPDVAAHSLAEVIGGAVAYNVAQLLGPVLQRLVDVQERPACIVCAAKAKREHLTAIANAQAAAEPEPGAPVVRQSFTAGRRGPVCWACLDPDQDGPLTAPRIFDFAIPHRAPDGE
jgi:hypothetical protein